MIRSRRPFFFGSSSASGDVLSYRDRSDLVPFSLALKPHSALFPFNNNHLCFRSMQQLDRRVPPLCRRRRQVGHFAEVSRMNQPTPSASRMSDSWHR